MGYCPICSNAPSHTYVTNCGHIFCGPCLAEYLWRQHYTFPSAHGSCSCPVCRRVVERCSPVSTAGQTTLLQVKLGRVFVEVATGSTGYLGGVCSLLKANSESLKIITAGKIVHTEEELEQVALSGRYVTLLCSRTSEQSMFDAVRRSSTASVYHLYKQLGRLGSLVGSLAATVWHRVLPFLTIPIAFMKSLSPSFDQQQVQRRRHAPE